MITIHRFLRPLKDGSTYFLGSAVKNEQGWRFMSNVASRRGSRKFYPTMQACVPRWVRPKECQVEVKRLNWKPVVALVAAVLVAAISGAQAAPRVERIATMRPYREMQPFTAASGYKMVKTHRVRVRPRPVPQGFVK